MAALSAASAHTTSGLIDPSKPGEYPILLGDRLAGKQSAKDSRFVNVNFNYKPKGASPQQRTTITRGEAEDLYNLTIRDEAGNAEKTTLTYKYQGSVDPGLPAAETEYSGLTLVFDPRRKAFILEPVSTSLNFNLKSGPGKDQNARDRYPQLKTLLDEAQAGKARGDDEESVDEDVGPADESNPFDFRHFLPKSEAETEKAGGKSPLGTSSELDRSPVKPKTSHLAPAAAAGPKSGLKPLNKPRPAKPKTNPLRQQKRAPTSTPAKASPTLSKAKPTVSPPRVEPEREIARVESSPGEDEQKKPEPPAAPSPNIIVDGDLIIDMGSPPPQRRPFKINPRHFSSNNTSGNEAGFDSDDDDDLEDPQLPVSLTRRKFSRQPEEEEEEEEEESDEDEDEDDEVEDEVMNDAPVIQQQTGSAPEEDEIDDNDDPIAAELKAAFEQTRLEEEQRARQLHYQRRQHVVSDDESEVSEEE